MYKGAATAEQFHSRSGNESTKGSRKGFGLLGEGQDPTELLSLEEKRDSLKAHIQWLQDCKKQILSDGGDFAQIILDIKLATDTLVVFRPAIKSLQASLIPFIFMDICRNEMTKAEFKRYLDKANEMQRGGKTAAQIRQEYESKGRS